MPYKLSKETRSLLKSYNRRWLPLLRHSSLAIIVAFFATYLFDSTAGFWLDLQAQRAYYSIRGSKPAPHDIVIVAIDDRSYLETHTSRERTISRRTFAEAFESIQLANPRLLIVDAKIPPERGIADDADQRIAKVLAATQSTIWTGRSSAEKLGETLPSDNLFRNSAKMELDMTLAETFRYVTLIDNQNGGSLYDRIALSRPLVELAGIKLEKPKSHEFINYYGGAGTLPELSLMDLVGNNREDMKERLKNKIVMLGYQSLSYPNGQHGKDEYGVPVGKGWMFGVEIHGNIVGNLLDKSWIKRAGPQTESLRVWLFMFLVGCMGMWRASLLTVSLISLSILVSFFAGYYAFSQNNFFFGGIGALLLSQVLTLAVSVYYTFRRMESYKAYLAKVFDFQNKSNDRPFRP